MKVETDLVIKLKFLCTREDILVIYAHFWVMSIPRKNQNCVQNMNQTQSNYDFKLLS